MSTESSARVHPAGGRALPVRWGLLLLALATAVIAGLLAMHGFSVGHHAAVETSDQHASVATSHSAPSAPANPQAASHAGQDPCPPLVCDGAAIAAMCLFVLLGLAFFMPRRGGSPWHWRPLWLTSSASHPPPSPGGLSGVSLTRLCISRT